MNLWLRQMPADGRYEVVSIDADGRETMATYGSVLRIAERAVGTIHPEYLDHVVQQYGMTVEVVPDGQPLRFDPVMR